MEKRFAAPQRAQPPAPAPPSWEQTPPPKPSNKRVSASAASLAAHGAARPGAVDGVESSAESRQEAFEDVAADIPLSPRRLRAAPRPRVEAHGSGIPEPVPAALLYEGVRQGHTSDAARVADVNAVFFERAYWEDLSEREVAYRLRCSVDKVASRFARIRVEGLRESLEQLAALATEASIEVAAKAQLGMSDWTTPSSEAAAALDTSALTPYDSIRAELLPSSYAAHVAHASSSAAGGARPGRAMAVRSACWDRAQRALRCGDLTMPLATYVLAMRTDTRGMMNRGLPVRVELSEDEALAWGRTPTSQPTASSPPSQPTSELLETLVGVSWAERQLALRILQGLSLTVYHQRRCIADGFLFHYATEQMQCFLQHVEARHSVLQREAMQAGWETAVHGKLSGSRSRGTSASPRHPQVAGGAAAPVVAIEENTLAALIALVDAVEAACHYSAAALSRLVQAGGVVALMNVVYCPYAPFDLRASILDSMSVLLQEVAPFRRMVVSSAVPQSLPHSGVEAGAGEAAAGSQDETLAVMLHGAFHGYSENIPINRAGTSQMSLQKLVHVGPPPYGLDRASASKFDSAVREWLSQHGLSHVALGILGLRNVSEGVASGDPTDPAEAARLQRASDHRDRRIHDLLLVIDGRRAELD